MNVAILGCGNISNTHALALTQLGHPIVLAVNHTLPKAEAFQKKWGVLRISDQFSALLDDRIDCVHICTPPALHYEAVKHLLLAGKHIICEKPLCLDTRQAEELMELAERKDLLAAVNFNIRYHEACQRAKALISSDQFGQPFLVSGSYQQEFHVMPNPYMWRYLPALGGSMRAVTEIGSHWIDLVRYWTGLEITQVSATFGRVRPDRYLKDGLMSPQPTPGAEPLRVDSEDAAVVTLHFSNGALGTLLLSEVSHGRNNCIRLEVSSPEQSVWWCSEDPYQLNQAVKLGGVTSKVNAFGGGFPDTFAAFFAQVYSALEHGKVQGPQPFPTFRDGYINAAVCDAIYKSAQNHSEWTEVI